jgi:hypothetical protein
LCRENLIDQSEADWPCPVYVGAFEALTGEKVAAGESAAATHQRIEGTSGGD